MIVFSSVGPKSDTTFEILSLFPQLICITSQYDFYLSTKLHVTKQIVKALE